MEDGDFGLAHLGLVGAQVAPGLPAHDRVLARLAQHKVAEPAAAVHVVPETKKNCENIAQAFFFGARLAPIRGHWSKIRGGRQRLNVVTMTSHNY